MLILAGKLGRSGMKVKSQRPQARAKKHLNFVPATSTLSAMITRRIQYSLLLLASLPLFALANVFKQGSPTRVVSSNMTIRWETNDESATVKFEVYRREFRSGGMGPAELVAVVDAKKVSNSVYQIVDGGIFKTADRVLQYEIRAVDQNNVVVETASMTTVFSSGLTSAAQRTWGSIKAMFR